MRKCLFFLTVSLCLLNLSCISNTAKITTANYNEVNGMKELNQWISDQLVPYLFEKMGTFPKYRGQPFIIVRMEDDEILPEIDDLTAEIRSRVKAELKAYKNVNLVWRPAVKPWGHHREIKKVKCNNFKNVKYFVGIDVQVMQVSGQLKVRVQCLDLKNERWENNFFLEWESSPAQAQLQALQNRQKDEHIRGLRPLPFSKESPDLLASYLAHNLSCLLKKVPSEEIRLQATRTGQHEQHFFTTALNLVDNYLDKFHSVTVTRTPEKANYKLTTEVHHISGSLYQIWAGLADLSTGQSNGLYTDVYVNLPATVEKISKGKREPLIDFFHLIEPEKSNPTNPYSIIPEKVVREPAFFSKVDQIAFKYLINRPAHYYLIQEDSKGSLKILFPNRCSKLEDDNYTRGRKLLRFPQYSSLGIHNSIGIEKIFLVAISDYSLSENFWKSISKYQGLCSTGMGYFQEQSGFKYFEDYLNWMQNNNLKKFQWDKRSFQIISKGY